MMYINIEKYKKAWDALLKLNNTPSPMVLNTQTLEDIKKWDDDNVQPDHIVEGIHNERGLVNKTSL
jgi:hypothetical protein